MGPGHPGSGSEQHDDWHLCRPVRHGGTRGGDAHSAALTSSKIALEIDGRGGGEINAHSAALTTRVADPPDPYNFPGGSVSKVGLDSDPFQMIRIRIQQKSLKKNKTQRRTEISFVVDLNLHDLLLRSDR